MSTFSFYLPDLGEGLKEAELVSWLVAVGDYVIKDQPLLTIETEKSLVEVPSPVAGRVSALHGEAGELLPVGKLLAEFETAQRADAGAIVGTLPGTQLPAHRDQSEAMSDVDAGGGTTVRAAPAVRAEARRRGIDLATISGSGRDGSISLADLDAPEAAEKGAQPLRGLRRSMARNMSLARQQVAHATVTGNADIEPWYGAEDPMLRLVQAVLAACAAEPVLNAWFDDDSESMRLHPQVDLGIATDTVDGLLVPTLQGAEQLSTGELRASLQGLQDSCAKRSLAPGQLAGQTITISNFGAIAGDYAQMVVVPPQVAIVGAGKIQRVPVADGKNIAIHARLPLSISFDHRVVSGGEAARFLKAMIKALEEPDTDNSEEKNND